MQGLLIVPFSSFVDVTWIEPPDRWKKCLRLEIFGTTFPHQLPPEWGRLIHLIAQILSIRVRMRRICNLREEKCRDTNYQHT